MSGGEHIKAWVKSQRPGAQLVPEQWGWAIRDGGVAISRIKSTPERAWADARMYLKNT